MTTCHRFIVEDDVRRTQTPERSSAGPKNAEDVTNWGDKSGIDVLCIAIVFFMELIHREVWF
jgi:hypothetical protein